MYKCEKASKLPQYAFTFAQVAILTFFRDYLSGLGKLTLVRARALLDIDWGRRRVNLRIVIAARGLNATKLANASQLSPNTINQFLNGTNETLSESTFFKIAPLLELRSWEDLDTDNPLSDPKAAIRRLLDQVPEEEIPGLLRELQVRFAHYLK